MVVQSKETAKQSSLIELLGGSTKSKNSKANDAFAQILSLLNAPVKGEKEEKNFGMILDPKTSTFSDAPKINTKILENLLNSEEKKALPKELINVLSNDQVHSLIHKAKEYLKNSIQQKSPDYKADPAMIPKTLMGLVELADTLGIDMSEITLSTLDDDEKPLFKEVSDSLLFKSVLESKNSPKADTPLTAKAPEPLVQALNETKAAQAEVKAVQPEIKAVKEIPKADTLLTAKAPDVLTQALNESKGAQAELKAVKESEKIARHPLQSLLKELKPSGEPSAVTPAPPEALKEFPKIPMSASMDTLGALLRATHETDKTESKEINSSAEDSSKLLQTHKEGSIEVKSKEAVQSLRHFAIDLKEAAESYKPPFTRVTMKLNPEKLGEIEVTLVQRGNNVHVNIQSSNANSVAFLAHNATELKAQLAGQGIPNATMNFMSGGENQSQNPNKQQQQQNRFQSYQSLLELESKEESLSALEIILPHYA